jgi:hypothetical protein
MNRKESAIAPGRQMERDERSQYTGWKQDGSNKARLSRAGVRRVKGARRRWEYGD